MPNDLVVRPTPPVAPVAEMSGVRDATPEVAAPPADTARPNPSLHLDGALGMVIIEFRSESGAVTTSIPTERQLEAYRMWERTGSDGAPPPGRPGHAAAPASVGDRRHAGTKQP
jgi:hypothetical protein